MAAMRIRHPEHGYTHVYTSEELKQHQALGWELEQPTAIEKDINGTVKLHRTPKRGRKLASPVEPND